MKIFSLETKKHLFGWSVVLGFFLNYLILNLNVSDKIRSLNRIPEYDNINGGWPFHVDIDYNIMERSYYQVLFTNSEYIKNLFFWILISLIILSLIWHFRKKNNQTTSK